MSVRKPTKREMEWDKRMDDKPKMTPKGTPTVHPPVAQHGPSLALLVKLGSIIVHADELSGPFGHPYDNITMQQLIRDPEVQQFIKDMGAFLPVKRNR